MGFKRFDIKVSHQMADCLSRASIENAKELLKDAKILFAKKRYARAYCLSVFAMEEIGKSELLFLVNFSEHWNQKKWRWFWDAFYKHQSKQRQLYTRGSKTNLTRKQFFSMETAKQLGLYVNILPNGTDFTEPQVLFTKSKSIVKKHIHFAEYKLNEAILESQSSEDSEYAKYVSSYLNYALANPDVDEETLEVVIKRPPTSRTIKEKDRTPNFQKLLDKISNKKITQGQVNRAIKKYTDYIYELWSTDHFPKL